jgi:hypothetical protein
VQDSNRAGYTTYCAHSTKKGLLRKDLKTISSRRLELSEKNNAVSKEISALRATIVLFDCQFQANEALIQKLDEDNTRIESEIALHDIVLCENQECFKQYTLTKKFVDTWKLADQGDFLSLVNEVFNDKSSAEKLSLCRDFLSHREESVIFKIMGHLWTYMSNLEVLKLITPYLRSCAILWGHLRPPHHLHPLRMLVILRRI